MREYVPSDRYHCHATGERSVNPIPGSKDPLLRSFLAAVPNQFAGLMDIRDLGAYSYGYAVTGQLGVLYDTSPPSRRLQATKTQYTGQDDGNNDIVLVDPSGNPLDPKTPPEIYCTDKSEKRVLAWCNETLNAMGGNSHANMDDLERQACMFKSECLGGIQDYSPAFQAMWKSRNRVAR
ncbi:hypothetical protein PsorP6_011086 [Peronosclerospora sorghi]|uniref:Uncharacterized protein n=1 Tax=Peronosclerospora sorghi TaxID=230839 RepID=A0ACC0VV53_9STRA|nr:hypothetical protein PsorP6_011086 [Peronosclerospora sorghi]